MHGIECLTWLLGQLNTFLAVWVPPACSLMAIWMRIDIPGIAYLYASWSSGSVQEIKFCNISIKCWNGEWIEKKAANILIYNRYGYQLDRCGYKECIWGDWIGYVHQTTVSKRCSFSTPFYIGVQCVSTTTTNVHRSNCHQGWHLPLRELWCVLHKEHLPLHQIVESQHTYSRMLHKE